MNIKYPTKVLIPHALIYRNLLDQIDVKVIEAKERKNKIRNNISLTHEEEKEEDRVKYQYYENLFNKLLEGFQDSEEGEEVDSNGRKSEMLSYNSCSDDDDKEIVIKTRSDDKENLPIPEIKHDSFYLEDSNLQLNIKDSLILHDNRLKKTTQKRNERKLLSIEKKEEIKTYDKERKQQKSKLYDSSFGKKFLKTNNNIYESNDELFCNKEEMTMEEEEKKRKQIAAEKRKKQRENKKYNKDIIYNKNNIAVRSDCDDCAAIKIDNNDVTKIDDATKVAAAAVEDVKRKKKAAEKKKRQRERKKKF